MVAFERCNPKEQTCKSKEEIDEYLEQSYILLIENSELFVHQLPPSSPEMHTKETKISWYAISTAVRTDSVKKLVFEDIHYTESTFGLGLTQKMIKIHNSKESFPRILPYKRPFQTSITFEIDLTLYELIKVEFSAFDWLSAIGGLTSIVAAFSQLIGNIEDPQ